MKRNLIGIFCFLLFSSLPAAAFAQMSGGMMQEPEHPCMGAMHGACGMMMDDEHPMWNRLTSLGLDEKQKDAVKALRLKTMKDMVRRRAEAQIADIELKSLLDKDPVDMKAVEAAAKKSESARTAVFLAHVSAHEELRAILTPEQKKRLKEMMGPGCRPGCSMTGGETEHKDMPMHGHMH